MLPSAQALAEQAAAEGRVLCLGTPNVFAAIAARGGRAHLVDRNPFVVRHLPHNEFCSLEIGEVAAMDLTGEPFRAAVLDPPWYPHCYNVFISRAVARLARPGILFVTLFRELTRPGALPGAVADVVESGGGVVSGLFNEPLPAFERRRRPRHERA